MRRSVNLNRSQTKLVCKVENHGTKSSVVMCRASNPDKNIETKREVGACLTAPSGLVSWWPGDGNANDIIGSNNGTYSGAYVAGEVGQSFSIQGRSNAVVIPNSASLELQTLTVDCWIRGTQPTSMRWILSKGSDGCSGPSYGFYSSGNLDEISFVVQDSPTIFQRALASVPGIWNGQWHHIAGSCDGTYVRLYVDGYAVAIVPYSGSVVYGLPSSNDLVIGGYLDCNQPADMAFLGDIDEVELFNRALTPTEILNIFNSGTDGICKPTPVTPQNPIIVRFKVNGSKGSRCGTLDIKGVTPVIIYGLKNLQDRTNNLDVTDIDVSSLRLNGLKVAFKNGSYVYSLTDADNDGVLDMTVKFDNTTLSAYQLSKSNRYENATVNIKLTGNLLDGTPIIGFTAPCAKSSNREVKSFCPKNQ
jgi:hypothetical protein